MKKNNHSLCDQKLCYLCQNCLPEWLPALEANKTVFKYKKGDVLFKEGEKVEGIFFINKGKAKVHKQWGNDKELIMRIANEGSIIGHRGLGGDGYYPVSGTALEDVHACFISLSFFHATLKVNPEFTQKLLMFFADELQESEKKMRNLAHMSVKGRLAAALLQFQQKFGVDEEDAINISLSRQDLSSYIGTTYETIFRMLNELEAKNAIQLIGKKIKICDKNILNDLMLHTSEG